MSNIRITIIIPTLNAEQEIARLLPVLQNQTVPVDEIIVIDSQSDDDTEKICRTFEKVTFISVARASFNHGGTRDWVFRQSKGDFVLFLTQDALPVDICYIEHLLKPFQDTNVAMVSSRQIARQDASAVEKLIREFNYPSVNNVRSEATIPKYGIKTFFVSNAGAAYRRIAYLNAGGFEPTITNEDMLIAARFIFSGYKIAYSADAKVIHSHQFTLKQTFIRNRKIGQFMRAHTDLFQNIPATKEGLKMAKYVLYHLIKQGNIGQSLYFCVECVVKWVAYKI